MDGWYVPPDWVGYIPEHDELVLITWRDDAIRFAHKLLREIQQESASDDADRLLVDVEFDLDQALDAWVHGDEPDAALRVEALYIARSILRFHRRAQFLQDLAAGSHAHRQQVVRTIIEAGRSAGRVHQDWAAAEIEVTAAYWRHAGDEE